jgi:hypothetical protein
LKKIKKKLNFLMNQKNIFLFIEQIYPPWNEKNDEKK